MPSGDTNLVLFDMAAKRIDPSCLGSSGGSTTCYNQINNGLLC